MSLQLQASHGAGSGKVRFAGAAGSAAASMVDLAAFAGEWDAVSDEDMPDDFQLSGKVMGLGVLALIGHIVLGVVLQAPHVLHLAA